MSERQPELTDDEDARKLQELALKHNKRMDTMEQARMDAIARLATNEPPTRDSVKGVTKARQMQSQSIKSTRKPEYVENEEIRKYQEIEYRKHDKMSTMEQARLDAIARMMDGDVIQIGVNKKGIKTV
eukprot:360686_1